MKYNTIREAAQAWVSEMEHIPTSVVEKLQGYADYAGYSDIREIAYDPNDEEGLPMWGWMFAMRDTADIDWFERSLDVVKQCGFRIYESEDFGYVFGVDGAGYDFYEDHWIPLYKARGLRWHKEDDLDECEA